MCQDLRIRSATYDLVWPWEGDKPSWKSHLSGPSVLGKPWWLVTLNSVKLHSLFFLQFLCDMVMIVSAPLAVWGRLNKMIHERCSEQAWPMWGAQKGNFSCPSPFLSFKMFLSILETLVLPMNCRISLLNSSESSVGTYRSIWAELTFSWHQSFLP